MIGQEDRFWIRVNTSICIGSHCGCSQNMGHCWPWTGCLNANGYGIVNILFPGAKRRTHLTHRVAYRLAYGPFAVELEVCHACDMTSCCRPDHLWLGTRTENMRDASSKQHIRNGFSPVKPRVIPQPFSVSVGPYKLPIELRFWPKVNRRTCLRDLCGCHKKLGHCWPWVGGRLSTGYGQFRTFKRGQWSHDMAHRIAYELTYGLILDGLLICHRCDNRPCCRPSHLFIGTQSDNIVDGFLKGRIKGAQLGELNHQAKLSNQDVRNIIALKGTLSQHAIARRFNVSASLINNIFAGRIWRHLTDSIIN